MQDQFEKIVRSRDCEKIVSLSGHPEPGEYIITGPQMGNLQGEGSGGWSRYVGYVVQVRKKAGAFGSDLLLIRHPDGVLSQHSNQSYYRMDRETEEKVKALFREGVTPDEFEDYNQAYNLGGGSYPEIGKVIEPKADGPPRNDSPMAKITVTHADGSKSIEIA